MNELTPIASSKINSPTLEKNIQGVIKIFTFNGYKFISREGTILKFTSIGGEDISFDILEVAKTLEEKVFLSGYLIMLIRVKLDIKLKDPSVVSNLVANSKKGVKGVVSGTRNKGDKAKKGGGVSKKVDKGIVAEIKQGVGEVVLIDKGLLGECERRKKERQRENKALNERNLDKLIEFMEFNGYDRTSHKVDKNLGNIFVFTAGVYIFSKKVFAISIENSMFDKEGLTFGEIHNYVVSMFPNSGVKFKIPKDE